MSTTTVSKLASALKIEPQKLITQLDDAGIIIVSGETYNDPVAIAMSKTLMELGFKDVKTLRGGIMGWEDAGEPVITK